MEIILNRFSIKLLTPQDRTVEIYRFHPSHASELGQSTDPKVVWRACYRTGIPAVVRGNTLLIAAQGLIPPDKLQQTEGSLTHERQEILDPEQGGSLRILKQLARRHLELTLKASRKAQVDKAPEGGLIISSPTNREDDITQLDSSWEIHRGYHLDVDIDRLGHVFLEVDLHHRFYTAWTLEDWQGWYPEAPIKRVRNIYQTHGSFQTWHYSRTSDEDPHQVPLPGSAYTSLADYHQRVWNLTDAEIAASRVVYVKRQGDKQETPHLSTRLAPSVTLEMLSYVADITDSPAEKARIEQVFDQIRAKLDERLTKSSQIAAWILKSIYHQDPLETLSPLTLQGSRLPPAKLLGKKGSINITANVTQRGCVRAGEDKIGCLDLVSSGTTGIFPAAVKKCLDTISGASDAPLILGTPRTRASIPPEAYKRQQFWQQWAKAGAKTILVVCHWLPDGEKLRIRKEALAAGIATQFMVASSYLSDAKVLNVALGLLVKAGWQPVKLQPFDPPQAAELVIGFDTGRNLDTGLSYGTAAFAALADGESLGWELPSVQLGEKIDGNKIRQVVFKLVDRFQERALRLPRRILLLRDGLVQVDEFTTALEGLQEMSIEADVVGIRKSGAGRLGKRQGSTYEDADKGSVVYLPQEDAFLLVTTKSKGQGSVRPLRAVRYWGNAPLEVLATQIYHLSELHPGSGFQSCRLPWVLHLADRSSKEFQRIGDIALLETLDREKLIAV